MSSPLVGAGSNLLKEIKGAFLDNGSSAREWNALLTNMNKISQPELKETSLNTLAEAYNIADEAALDFLATQQSELANTNVFEGGIQYGEMYAKTLGRATIAQSALTAATEVFSTLALMAVITALTTGISKAYDTIAHGNENAIKAMDEVKTNFESTTNEISDNISTLEGMSSEYAILAKGVDENGSNISLTADQYERYQEIVSTIAGLSPSLVASYGDENVLLSEKNGLLEEAIRLQKEAYKSELEGYIENDNLQTVFEGYKAEYAKLEPTDSFGNVIASLMGLGYEGLNKDAAETLLARMGVLDIDKELEKYLYDGAGTTLLNAESFMRDYGENIAQEVDSLISLTSAEELGISEEAFTDLAGHAREIASTYDSIRSLNEDVASEFRLIAEANSSYDDLGTGSKKIIETYIEQLADIENLGTDYRSIDSLKTSINDFLNSITPEVDDKIKSLFSLDRTQFVASDFAGQAQDLISDISKALNLDSEMQESLALSLDLEVDDEGAIVTVEEMVGKIEDVMNAAQTAQQMHFVTESSLADDLNYSDLQTAYHIVSDIEKMQNNGTISETGSKMEWDELIDKVSEYNDLREKLGSSVSDEDARSLYNKILQYEDLSKQIDAATESGEKLKLIEQQNTLGDEIQQVGSLAAGYESLTSAYNAWVAAKETANAGDMYSEIATGQHETNDLRQLGEFGTDEFKEFVEMVSGNDLSNLTASQYAEEWDRVYQLTQKYFTEGKEGCEAFARELEALNTEEKKFVSWDTETGTGTIAGSLSEMAQEFGISEAAVEAILGRLQDYGWTVHIQSDDKELIELESKVDSSIKKLKELQDAGQINVDVKIPDIDFTSTNIEDYEKWAEEYQEVYGTFGKNEDGTIDVSVEGAEEAKLLLETLIEKKYELTNPLLMKIDTSGDNLNSLQETVKQLQELQNLQKEYDIKIAIGDTAGAGDIQSQIQGLVSQLNQDNLGDLGITVDVSGEVTTVTVDPQKLQQQIDAGYLSLEANTVLTPDRTALDAENYEQYSVVHYTADTSTIAATNFNKTATITYVPKSSTDPVLTFGGTTGGGGARGTAFRAGSWGTRKGGTALGGELGQELIVRDGRFFTIGDQGAEFFKYKKDDIIFNAEQTKQIFEKGKITAGNRHGYALADGTAFASGSSSNSPGMTSQQVLEASMQISIDKISIEKEAYDDDFEDTLNDMKDAIDDAIGDYEHEILLMEHNSASDAEIIAVYRRAQEALNEQAEAFRAQGLDENSDYIQDLQKQWWDYEDEINDMLEQIDEDFVESYETEFSKLENAVTLTSHSRDKAINEGDAEPVFGSTSDMISSYRAAQEKVHELADYYRSLGYDENSDEISELSEQWWEYEENITDAMTEAYNSVVEMHENVIGLTEKQLSDATSRGSYYDVKKYTNRLLSEIAAEQQDLHEQADYYRSLGYSDYSEEVVSLSEQWWELEEKKSETLESGYQALKEAATDALDTIQSAYDTLKTAASEYATSGYISIDTMQELLDYGVEYLSLLTNENGELVLNEETINKVIKARTEQVGIETALNYIASLRQAIANNEIDALNELLDVTNETSDATWGLVYAELKGLGLSKEQAEIALKNVNSIYSLTTAALDSIGKGGDALEDILDYTIDMIKQETEDYIDMLEEEIDDYKEIISLQKESLETTKKQSDYNKTVSDKLKDIAELQAKINQLSLDDSREAQVEKASLEEELADLQEDLADTQADYAYDATVDALDKMADAYEEEKNEEIEIANESISSYQKLYELAVARIEEEGADLIDQLLAWNSEYGNDLNSTIVEAWNNASSALETYMYNYEQAMKNITSDSDDSDGSTGALTTDTPGAVSSYSSGDTAENAIKNIVANMKYNSAMWASTDDDAVQIIYDRYNVMLAAQLADYGVNAVRDDDSGVWYIDHIGGRKLYDVYHQGGVVGGSGDIKDNEVLSLLENGELVLNDSKKETLYKFIDISDYMLSKIGKAVSGLDLGVISSGVESISAASGIESADKSSLASIAALSDGTSNVIGSLEVNVPVQVLQKLDKDDIQECSKAIGEVSAKYIHESFAKRGITSAASLF